MAHLEEIPLFPLHTVLFPHASLHLNVFEERYHQMLRYCLEYDQPFGIVLIRSGSEVGGAAEPYMVGTACRITRVQERDDARTDVYVEGTSRFRIRKLDETRPYLVGYVEPVIEGDMENEGRTQALMHRVTEIFQDLVQMEIGRRDFSVEIRATSDPVALSFVIAGFLPMENLDKQRLLEITNSDERLSELIQIMEKAISESTQPTLVRVNADYFRDWLCDN